MPFRVAEIWPEVTIGEDERRFVWHRALARRWTVCKYDAFFFWNPFAAQMTGIYKNNGILKVILSFAEKGQFHSKKSFSQPTSQCISQLRIECHCAAKWHTCAKIAFAIAKYPVEWNFGCEIRDFHALSLCSRFAAANWGLLCCKVALVCQTWLRRGVKWVAGWFGSKVLFSQRISLGCEVS